MKINRAPIKKTGSNRIIKCLDEVADHRRAVETLASLLEGCGEGIDVVVVNEAAAMILDELGKLKSGMERLKAEALK